MKNYITLSISIILLFILSLPFSFPFAKSYPVWIVLKGFTLNFLFAWYLVNHYETKKNVFLTIQLVVPFIVLGVHAAVNFPQIGVGFIPVLVTIIIGALSGYFAAQYKKALLVYASLAFLLVVTAQLYLPVFFEQFKTLLE